MTEPYIPYNPVTRPPKNPSVRTRKISRDRIQNNLNSLTKQIHLQLNSANAMSSSTELTVKKDGAESALNRVSNLEKTLDDRASSFDNLALPSLAQHRRSLSASNMHALADPDLSIKAAVSKKAYDKPHTSFSREKAIFTAWTQKYYHQLTIGCGDSNCTNIFCKSSSRQRPFDARMAALISIELAGYKNYYLCVKDKKRQSARLLDPKIFELTEDEMQSNEKKKIGDVPFLYAFYSMSPFRSLFLPCPLTPSGLGLHKTHSASEIDTSSKTRCDHEDHGSGDQSSISSAMKSHLSSITSTISSSFNNIFKMASLSSTTDEKSPLSLESKENDKILNKNKGSRASTSESGDSNILRRDSGEKVEENFIPRTRIPSVRIFGTEHAVDTELESQLNIDQFEAEVAQEFRQISVNDVENSAGSIEEDDDVVALHGNDGDSDGQESDGFSLTHLTLDMFSNVLLNYKECKDESFLQNTLRTVFSSWQALQMSFKDEGLPRKKASSATKFPFDVKVSNVVEAFNLLQTIENADKFKTLLTDTIQVMLMKKQRTLEPHDLKPFVIVLAMPYLFDYVHVVYELAAAIHALPDECLKVLAHFIAECFDVEQIKTLVLVSKIMCSFLLSVREKISFLS